MFYYLVSIIYRHFLLALLHICCQIASLTFSINFICCRREFCYKLALCANLHSACVHRVVHSFSLIKLFQSVSLYFLSLSLVQIAFTVFVTSCSTLLIFAVRCNRLLFNILTSVRIPNKEQPSFYTVSFSRFEFRYFCVTTFSFFDNLIQHLMSLRVFRWSHYLRLCTQLLFTHT